MTLYRKKHGIWYYDFVHNGQRFSGSTRETTKPAARRVEDAAKEAAKRTPNVRMTFLDAVKRGYRERWSHKKDGEQTIQRLEVIADIVGPTTPLHRIDRGTVEAIRAALSDGRSPATVNRHMAALKTLFRMAHQEWGALDVLPFIRLAPETPEERRALTPDEVERILVATERTEAKRLFRFLVDTGLRLGEALKLTSEDVREGCVYLSDTKSGRPRVVPLTQAARQAVEGIEGRLFCLGKWTFERDFREAVEKAGVDPKGVVLHSLRHTCCTRLVERGAGIVAAGAVLGHSTQTMTRRYSHLDVEHLKKTIGLLEDDHGRVCGTALDRHRVSSDHAGENT